MSMKSFIFEKSHGQGRSTLAKQKLDPLLETYYKGDFKKMKDLIKGGMDVNSHDKGKMTVLMFAVRDKEKEIVEFLLENGADVNLKDVDGMTALDVAARVNSEDMAALLLKYKPVIDPQDKFGNTPLMSAVRSSRGKGEVIKLLLANGADREIKNKSGITPLGFARTIANYNVHQFFE